MELHESSSRERRAKEFANIHAQARVEAKKSQEYMALSLGVSKKTIQNWEKSLSSPTFFQSLEWFRTLSINPFPYYCKLATPNLNNKSIYKNDSEINETFNNLVNILSPAAKRAIIYVFLGNHGSSPVGLLQLVLAYLHLPLKARASHTSHLLHDYETELRLGGLYDKDKELPDVEVLMNSYTQANEAILKQLKSYYDL